MALQQSLISLGLTILFSSWYNIISTVQAGKSQVKYSKHRSVYTNYWYRTTLKYSVICTGVMELALPTARTINYHLVCFALMAIWHVLYTNTWNGFIATTLKLYISTINLPTWRENLDSTLKRSYPFVTLFISYTWSVMALQFEMQIYFPTTAF